jgi:hypothetical protein
MTVTVKLATPTFPSLSVAVHVTVLDPIGRSVTLEEDPVQPGCEDAGEQLTEARDEVPSDAVSIKFPLPSHTGRLEKSKDDLEVPSHKVTDEFIPE